MKVVAFENFKKLKPSTVPMELLHYHLSGESYQDASTNATHPHIILQFTLTKGMVAPLLTTMWDHTTGCAN